jgi:hypothetical protein
VKRVLERIRIVHSDLKIAASASCTVYSAFRPRRKENSSVGSRSSNASFRLLRLPPYGIEGWTTERWATLEKKR